jgi:hypothetical protein
MSDAHRARCPQHCRFRIAGEGMATGQAQGEGSETPSGAVDAPERSNPPSGRTPRGPGWYESSFELMRGLEVTEGMPHDATLDEWLEQQLASMPPLDPDMCEL